MLLVSYPYSRGVKLDIEWGLNLCVPWQAAAVGLACTQRQERGNDSEVLEGRC